MPRGTIEISLIILALLSYAFDARVTLISSLAAIFFIAIYHYIHLESEESTNIVNAHRAAHRAENVEWVLKAVKVQGSITVKEVEKLLGVSDATAGRYLQELEETGKLVQIGKHGRGVSYKLNINPFYRYI